MSDEWIKKAAESVISHLRVWCRTTQEDVDIAIRVAHAPFRAKVEALVEAVEDMGGHPTSCKAWHGDIPKCDCGWNAVAEAIRSVKEALDE